MKKFNPYPWLILFCGTWLIVFLSFEQLTSEEDPLMAAAAGLLAGLIGLGIASVGTESFDPDRAIINELDCGDEEY